MIRTRFAPSPTGYLHIGGARTALFAWAYAHRYQGECILRIEDTDSQRSTPAAIEAILDGLNWLGLTYHRGPFYQTQRLARYQEVIGHLLYTNQAYYCYMQPAELEALRCEQRRRGQKPRYDNRWRPENMQQWGLSIPPNIKPVVRFRNPDTGTISWVDHVKGPVTVANAELDDCVIARADGQPTYNFCVVIDDWDMGITHVIRGEDHVSNTPRQINIGRALAAPIPIYAHLPLICGTNGQKLSKRRDAVSVMYYAQEGFLAEAFVNALARLGWSHQDADIFSREQFVEWFDMAHISPSAAQFDLKKLRWLNAQYIKKKSVAELHTLFTQWMGTLLSDHPAYTLLAQLGSQWQTADPMEQIRQHNIIALYQDRVHTLYDLLQQVVVFFVRPCVTVQPDSRIVWQDLCQGLQCCVWTPENIHALVQGMVTQQALRIIDVATPLRMCLLGQTQGPSFAQIIWLMGREETQARLLPLLHSTPSHA